MSLEPKPTHPNIGLGGGASNRSAMVLEVLHDGEVKLVACGGKGQVERLPETDPRLASLPCLPVLVNHRFGVASGQVVMDLCVILVHTFQCCE